MTSESTTTTYHTISNIIISYRTHAHNVNVSMTTSSSAFQSSKYCFVTIGATASFASLVRAVLSPAFVAGLEAQNYTNLLVQYGADGAALYQTEIAKLQNSKTIKNITVDGFGLDQAGLGNYMSLAKGGVDGKGQQGVVVSHAGNTCSFPCNPLFPNPCLCLAFLVEWTVLRNRQARAAFSMLCA